MSTAAQAITIVMADDDAEDRMLAKEAEALWLDPLTEDTAVLKQLLVPFPPELMDSYPVSTLGNSFKNQGREIIEPVAG